jgi:RNA polymerase sigma factor (sigma-70 family)
MDHVRGDASMPNERARQERDERLVRAFVEGGDHDAFGELYREYLDGVIAWVTSIVGIDAAEDVTMDTFVRAHGKCTTLKEPRYFKSWLFRTARNRAIDHLRRERRSRPVDHDTLFLLEGQSHRHGGRVRASTSVAEPNAPLISAAAAFTAASASPPQPDAAIGDDRITWDIARSLLTPAVRDVVELHWRHELTISETAQVLGIDPNAAHQRLRSGRLRLRAYVLWRDGHPECADLAQRLEELGLNDFSARTATVINAHASAGECSVCRRCPAGLSALLVWAPIAVAPDRMRNGITTALLRAGLPMASPGDGMELLLPPQPSTHVGRSSTPSQGAQPHPPGDAPHSAGHRPFGSKVPTGPARFLERASNHATRMSLRLTRMPGVGRLVEYGTNAPDVGRAVAVVVAVAVLGGLIGPEADHTAGAVGQQETGASVKPGAPQQPSTAGGNNAPGRTNDPAAPGSGAPATASGSPRPGEPMSPPTPGSPANPPQLAGPGDPDRVASGTLPGEWAFGVVNNYNTPPGETHSLASNNPESGATAILPSPLRRPPPTSPPAVTRFVSPRSEPRAGLLTLRPLT